MVEPLILVTPTTDVTTTTPTCESTIASTALDPLSKTWEEFESCPHCQGRAQIDETADGDLVCRVCHAMLPKPSS